MLETTKDTKITKYLFRSSIFVLFVNFMVKVPINEQLPRRNFGSENLPTLWGGVRVRRLVLLV